LGKSIGRTSSITAESLLAALVVSLASVVSAQGSGMATDPGLTIWFTEINGNRIARFFD
jgi:hypothetical protein